MNTTHPISRAGRQAIRAAANLRAVGVGILAMVGVLAEASVGAAAARRTRCDLKLTDSLEREIERRLLSRPDQNFRSPPFRY
jgi:hypothetical protein